jgi:hypothetical protein
MESKNMYRATAKRKGSHHVHSFSYKAANQTERRKSFRKNFYACRWLKVLLHVRVYTAYSGGLEAENNE